MALKLNPKYYKIYGKRGLAKFEIKDYEGAMVDCRVALEIDPKNEAVSIVLSKIEQVIKKEI